MSTSTEENVEETPQHQVTVGPRMMGATVPVERSKDFRNSTLRLISWMRPERFRLFLVLSSAVISVMMSVVGPKILGNATNVIISGVQAPTGIDFPELHRTLLIVVGLYLGSAAMAYFQGFLLAGVIHRTMRRLRSAVENKINRLPLGYIDRTPRGDLLSRVTNDIDNIAQSLAQSLSMLFISLLTVVGVLIMMLTISPLLSLVAVATVPVTLITIKYIAGKSKKRFIAQWSHTGALNGIVEETFAGHSLVKVFGQQQATEDRFEATNQKLFEAAFGAQFISGMIQPAMMLVSNLNYVAIAVIGGLRVASGNLSIGDIQAFIQYSRQFTQPINQLASLANMLQSGIASAERVFEFLDVDEQSPDPVDAQTVASPKGRVAFNEVTFSYSPNKPLIADLSLIAEPGQTIAIVGPTGAGKTTLVNLLMRFYELNGGAITLDGVDISKMRRDDLRSSMGMVLQDTWLFGGTIRDNIAYGRLDATEEEIVQAAKATHVDHFVRAMPDGYNTILDDEASNLSAGEKQLLTIARAFLAEPTILILDEATSSVDTRTEVLIQHAMAALRSNRTSFVIAHRLSTIRDADIILVMENGSIVEQGNHEELLAAGGAYYNLYNAQFVAAAIDLDAN
ncbi:MAG: ABC transporter ATP-binding protein/permease [Actinobacteria bacterium]|jgi:ATP-binding cassette subfamily B multidrug efflux pump|nr:ABC transporter ATP-binding protein/permease [Actinomycetota bacterium]